MTGSPAIRSPRWGWLVALILLAGKTSHAADAPVTQEQLLLLQQQNQQLQQQLHQQQGLIDTLSRQVSAIQQTKTADAAKDEMPTPEPGFRLGKVDISGEGGLAFFESQSSGQTPDPEFRVDEARVFLEAPVWNDTYFFTEINLATREQNDLGLRFGELYLDFEDVSKLWGVERLLNLRIGRFYIPFGEEYLNRFAIDNPLISHSLSDLWGEDNGVELYGALGRVQYIVAVQNGGVQASRDFTGDKSVTARISYDPAKWLHLSLSGMRTGDLDSQQDVLSAMWFGGGFFRSLGAATTTRFHADLVEGDAQIHLSRTQLKAAAGYIHYGDNNPAASDNRDVYYYYAEGKQNFTRKFYAAARFSEVFAHNGFPIVGNGNMGTYLFNELTTQYWRLSLGLGYELSRNLLVKGEYSFNRGRELDGEWRNHEDLFALEAAYKF